MSKILLLMLFKYCLSAKKLQTCTKAPENQVCTVNEDYDKSKFQGKLPLMLTPTFDIYEVTEFDVISGSISITIRLMIDWEDKNITFNQSQMS